MEIYKVVPILNPCMNKMFPLSMSVVQVLGIVRAGSTTALGKATSHQHKQAFQLEL